MAGRPMKYTAAEFEAAVEKYFGRISIEQEMIRDGKPLLDQDGEPITYTEWLRPPTVAGICLALGIDPSTWQNYANKSKSPKHAIVCERASLRIECYLEELLATKEKSVQGVLENLRLNYWRKRRVMEEEAESRQASPIEGMSMAQKLALIRDMAGGGGDGGEKADESAD